MKPKKLLAFVWAAVMIISLLPVCTLSVLAETTQKNITLGTAALSSGNTVNQRYVHIYYGKYPQ